LRSGAPAALLVLRAGARCASAHLVVAPSGRCATRLGAAYALRPFTYRTHCTTITRTISFRSGHTSQAGQPRW